MFEIVLRLVFSLAAVIGLMLLVARFAQRRFEGRPGAVVSVVHRQPISKHASVAVVTVGSRVLVLGATEQQVQMITELDPLELVPFTAPTPAVAGEIDAPGEWVAEESLDVALPGLDHLDPRVARVAVPAAEATTGGMPFARLLRAESERRTQTQPALALVPASAPRQHGLGADSGPLAGSLLSPTTWRRAYAAVTGRAS